MTRKIIHVDMDAFFASVEQRDNPEFIGKPVIVGANHFLGRGRGVVSAASYEARKFGIHSAQPISQAYRLCPNGIFLPVRGRRYQQVSRKIMAIFRQYTPLVEPISLDEAFLDMTGTERLLGNIEEVGRRIKEQIWEEERLTASVGIGPNKLIAKIASDLKKPDGFVVVKDDEVEEFLNPLPVGKLWGIGEKTEEKLSELGIYTIGQLAALPEETLQSLFGKMGLVLYQHARGIDNDPVMPFRKIKSISNETTFEKDVIDINVIRETLLALSDKVGYRLRQQELLGKTVILKVRFSDFSTLVRHSTLPRPIFMSEKIYAEIFNLLEALNISFQPVRLLGVGITQLSSANEHQMSLFEDNDGKRKRVTEAVDQLKSKFGEKVIGRGLFGKGF